MTKAERGEVFMGVHKATSGFAVATEVYNKVAETLFEHLEGPTVTDEVAARIIRDAGAKAVVMVALARVRTMGTEGWVLRTSGVQTDSGRKLSKAEIDVAIAAAVAAGTIKA